VTGCSGVEHAVIFVVFDGQLHALDAIDVHFSDSGCCAYSDHLLFGDAVYKSAYILTCFAFSFACRDSRVLPDGVLQRFLSRVEWRHTDDVSGVREDAAGTLHPGRLQPRLFQRRHLAVRRAVLGPQVVRRQRTHARRHTTVSARLRVVPRGQLRLHHRYVRRMIVHAGPEKRGRLLSTSDLRFRWNLRRIHALVVNSSFFALSNTNALLLAFFALRVGHNMNYSSQFNFLKLLLEANFLDSFSSNLWCSTTLLLIFISL